MSLRPRPLMKMPVQVSARIDDDERVFLEESKGTGKLKLKAN
jgi:hypothetical protein